VNTTTPNSNIVNISIVNTSSDNIYTLTDKQQEFLYKLKEYILRKDDTESIHWIRPYPPTTHRTIYKPIEFIDSIVEKKWYDDRDKNELNDMREFWLLYIGRNEWMNVEN